MRITTRRATFAALLTSTALIASPALAQDAAAEDEADSTEIVVTAQKRSESLQNVPISIQAIGTQKLEQLNISNFSGYAQQLPSVSFQGTGTPGVNVIYMRGVASGGDGNHSGSLPSVGVYLDEQPVTTIGGNLDVYVYDIARIESLSGPQGTLYGASSQAGTIRIITNKPDPSKVEGGADFEVNSVAHGKIGGKLEFFANAPINNKMAIRVVGYYKRDAGYIDNVPGCRAFLPETNPLGCPPATNGGIRMNNAAFVEADYNEAETIGGRAALGIELDDNWTITPAVMYQSTSSRGSFAYDPSVGDLEVQHFFPEYRKDHFTQAALTIEGKIGNWDITYAGAYLDRKTASSSDYTDYAEAYDSLYSSYGGLAGYFYFTDSLGNTINPSQKVIGSDHFKKASQELRIASPSDARIRLVAGLFWQRQTNDIHQDYQVANLGPLVSVNGLPGTLWLTEQYRVDKDYAAFGELSFDLTDQLTFTAGGRYFKYDNTLVGFFGFGRNPNGNYSATPYNAAGSSRTGVAGCFTTTGSRLRPVAGTPGVTLAPPVVAGSPCTNLGVWNGSGVDPVRAKDDGFTWRANLNYKPNSDLLLYATASKGFRPGGINRRADVAPYAPDFLYNYELGWKATLAPGFRINGAIYQQDWKKFQFSFLGANSFTEIHNGPDARIRGIDLSMAYNRGPLSLQVDAAYTDAKMTKNLCAIDDPTYACTGPGNSISSPAGTRLPITPKFKAAATMRYTAEVGATTKAYGQVNASYQSSAPSEVRAGPAAIIGELPEFATVNLAFGMEWEKFNLELFASNVFDERGQVSRFLQCGQCGQRPYVVPIMPRTIGVRLGVDF
ncbi:MULTISPECIES: TonB-dependent receptor [unclassified Novosphingobium]|uniref:TonB-dependent receptor n=1 Tax=unclassified Novosphingobium TaxID=2644732 RepID=UPI0025FE3498|nr:MULTISPECIES: TonB-dependent receptor [unclassified Novosphingobium]HQV02059.1 TonB-dependent receptor [Novosphingobium sp.]